MPAPERPAEIRSVLRRLRGAFRQLCVLHGTGRVLLLMTAIVVGLFALDYFLVLPAGVRVVLLLGALAGLGSTAWRWLLRPVTRPLPDIELAGRLEASHPELRDKLLAAVAFTAEAGVDARESGALVAATIAEARAAVATVQPHRAAPGRRAWRYAGAGVGACTVLALAALAQPVLARTWLQRAWGADVRWPQRTQLTVLTPTARVTKVGVRTAFTIAVEAHGSIPSRATLHLDLGTGVDRPVRLARETGNQFRHEITSVAGSFSFWVEAGDGRTDRYRVDALVPPDIEQMHAWLTHPPHTRLPDTPLDHPLPDGNVRAPVGTHVRLEAVANKPIAEGALIVGGEQTLPLRVAGGEGRQVGCAFDVAEDGTYVVRLTDTEGLTGTTPFRYRIRAVADRAPGLRPVFPSGDRNATPVAVLPLACEVTDDYGVATVQVHFGLVGTGEIPPPTVARDAPVAREADGFGPKATRVAQPLDLATLSLQPAADQPARPVQVGDRLRLWFEATDHRPSPEPNRTRSREYTITIESTETLERLVGEQLARLRQTVELTRLEQERALRKAEQLGSETDPNAEAEVVGAQRQVVRRTGQMADQFTGVAEEAAINKLGDPTYRAGLVELATVAGQVATTHAASAAQQLEQARRVSGIERRQAIAGAREAQARASGLLSELLSRLERWEELADVLWGLRRVKDRQEELKDRVLKELKAKAGGD